MENIFNTLTIGEWKETDLIASNSFYLIATKLDETVKDIKSLSLEIGMESGEANKYLTHSFVTLNFNNSSSSDKELSEITTFTKVPLTPEIVKAIRVTSVTNKDYEVSREGTYNIRIDYAKAFDGSDSKKKLEFEELVNKGFVKVETQGNSINFYNLNDELVAIATIEIDVGIKRVIVVEELPTTNIDSNAMYLLKRVDGKDNDYYEEYLYINNQWEKVGTTQIDLSNYYTIAETDNLIKEIKDLVDSNNNAIYLLKGRIDDVDHSVSDLSTKVTDIHNTIGDTNTSGTILYNISEITKDINEINIEVGKNKNSINAIEEKIADEIEVDIKNLDDTKETKRTIEQNTTDTEITLTPIAKTDYTYGELSSLSLTFSNEAPADLSNSEIDIIFKSGETPTTLTISKDNAVFEEFVPSPNSIIEINAKWYINKWVLVFAEVDINE